ncbi:MlaE family ABC transporter permease [Roseomonas chloroacetimidivorans]|uniref:MlaE family ABC transporter permease n=1 Tax=Roseomonas chloroacetimidivorans TaxID=1766656 RepID=UPI003C78CABB
MTAQQASPGWQVHRQGTEAELRLTGDWIAHETGLRDSAAVRQVLTETEGATRLRFESSGLGRWDSALVVFLQALQEAAAASVTGAGQRIELDGTGLPEATRRLLTLAAETGPAPPVVAPPVASLFTRVGRKAIARWADGVAVSALVGETVLRSFAALRGRVRTRGVDVLELMREAGAGALGIVAIVNSLVGGILAFVGAVQLRRFGAEIFVADLVGIAMVREMAAVMTAIVMAGRTGGAYAAQIATMQGNEEIDALKALGIPVFDYLVLPRIIALVAMMPLLYLYASAVGLLGGLAVGMATLDLTATAYFQETRQAISGTQFVFGLTKSVAFGALVALAGCHIGLKAGRSAADVGRAATSAVVAGIIGVIALDAIFAVCADALGI